MIIFSFYLSSSFWVSINDKLTLFWWRLILFSFLGVTIFIFFFCLLLKWLIIFFFLIRFKRNVFSSYWVSLKFFSVIFELKFYYCWEWTFLYHRCWSNQQVDRSWFSFHFCVWVMIFHFRVLVFQVFLFKHWFQLLIFIVCFCDLLIILHRAFCSLPQSFWSHFPCSS